MRIDKRSFIDASEPDANGLYEHYYEGEDYRVSLGDVTYTCRSYRDAPGKLMIVKREVSGRSVPLSPIPYTDATFRECIAHFRTALGFTHFEALTMSGYQAIDTGKLHSN